MEAPVIFEASPQQPSHKTTSKSTSVDDDISSSLLPRCRSSLQIAAHVRCQARPLTS
ncbi:hypothetical protein Plhal304r1_c003g0014031 [Plasmopara halstedii]